MTEPTHPPAPLPASLVLREIRNWRPDLLGAIRAREPADAESILAELEARAGELSARAPDPGAMAPLQRAFTASGVLYVAAYLTLAARGYDAARAWAICEDATRSRFARMRGLERSAAASGLFSWPMKALSRWTAGRSQAAPVGGWVFDFVEAQPEHGIDYGVDYRRCAIRDFAHAVGAGDFAPYICLADVVGSDELGWGLARTETIAQGGTRCDFRFRRGRETDVKVRLPTVG